MLNPYGAERFVEDYRREAEAFIARQRLILQAERNATRRRPAFAGFVQRLVRAVRQQAARPERLISAVRKT